MKNNIKKNEIKQESIIKSKGILEIVDNMWDIFSNTALGRIFLGKLDAVVNWARKNSLWPLGLGLSCCAIEMIHTGGPRFDLARFGMEVFRPSPRQADLIIMAGTVTKKMAPVVRRLYDQMPDPKWVIAMGVCTSTGGVFNTYSVVQGIDEFLPVDVYVPGCPPHPEGLLYGLMKLQEKISKEKTFSRKSENA